MSRTTASGRNSRPDLIASVPLPAVCTDQPSYRSTLDRSSARLGSSSTTRTRTAVPSACWVPVPVTTGGAVAAVATVLCSSGMIK